MIVFMSVLRYFYLQHQRGVISRSGVVFLFLNDSIKVKCKVTLLVHEPRTKCYISSVVFETNLN